MKSIPLENVPDPLLTQRTKADEKEMAGGRIPDDELRMRII
jgi:hypothetical protein